MDYIFSKANRPANDQEKDEIKRRFKSLSTASALSSLLYTDFNTRSDILWITNKLAKSSSDPGIKDFEAIMHIFGYLRAFPDYGQKIYTDPSQS